MSETGELEPDPDDAPGADSARFPHAWRGSPRARAAIRAEAVRRLSRAAKAAAAVAVGALAIGTLAIGSLAIGRLVIGRARVRTLRIDKLIIGEIERK